MLTVGRICGGGRLRRATLSSFGDHQIALACIIPALAAEDDSKIVGAKDAEQDLLPGFWDLLKIVAE